jgi:hypothetical protein
MHFPKRFAEETREGGEGFPAARTFFNSTSNPTAYLREQGGISNSDDGDTSFRGGCAVMTAVLI